MLKLRAHLPQTIKWQNLVGGLAADTDRPMPHSLQTTIQGHWHKIQTLLDTPFNFDFWSRCYPRRDTYKACRAVIAAADQGFEDAMIEGIQRAYYLDARNPSEPDVLIEIAAELGMGKVAFADALASVEVNQELNRQLATRDALAVTSFPSLVLTQGRRITRIRHDYNDFRVTLKALESNA